MKQLLLPIFFLLTVVSMAQTIDAPIAWTDFLRLKQYAYEANPGADSLNHNNTLIDNFAKASNDSANALKADVYTTLNYSGLIKPDIITWAQLASATKSVIVQTTGVQNIAGIKTTTDTWNTENLLPREDETYTLGGKDNQWFRGYFNAIRTGVIYITNGTEDDSMAITYDGTDVQFNKPVTIDNFNITTEFKMDSAASFNSLRLQLGSVVPSNVSDSVLTIDSLQANVRINAPGDMTNVENIVMTGASNGTMLILWSYDLTDDITFEDSAPDGNLNLAGNFTLSAGDCITLMYYYDQPNMQYRWMEISRSNN